MKKLIIPFLIVLSCALFVSAPAGAQQAASNPLEIVPADILTGAIDNQAIEALPSSVHPKALPEYDAGPVERDLAISRMTLILRRSPAQQAALDALSTEQQTPGSPQYHQWLTPEEFGSHFGLSQNDLNKLTLWLKQNGLAVNEIRKGRWTIVFSGTAAQVETAFHTEVHYYNVNGTRHRANSIPLQIPKALLLAVQGVLGIHDFVPLPAVHQGSFPDFGGGESHYLFPSDYATIYDINPLYSGGLDGSGQTIGIVGRCNIDPSIVQTFRSLTGLAPNNTSVVPVPNTQTPAPCSSDELLEPFLDVEWSGAVAPNANIVLAVAPDIGDSATYIVEQNSAAVMSTSFGSCEADNQGGGNQFWSNLWEQAASQGITSMISSGDSGAAGCDLHTATSATHGLGVNALCTPPTDICVGGSEFNDSSNPALYWSPQGNALGYIPEEAWNESGSNGGSDLWSSGGGYSIIYAKTSAPWQTGNSSDWRGVPDVSLSAAGHDGYFVCLTSDCNTSSFTYADGTSAASPSFAGMMALLVEKTGQRQGAANSLLYALSSKANVFNDIVLGNNSVPGLTGFNAGTGWDAVTGLGSVDANLLVTNWGSTSSKAPSALVSPSTVTFGDQLVGKSSASKVVTVTNTGSAAMAISGFSLKGADPGDFPTTTTCPNPGSLPAGHNCELTITFKPSASGVRTASLALSDNAPGSPQTISLSGIGTSSASAQPGLVQALTSTANGIANGSCTAPAPAVSFSVNAPAVWLYFDVNGVNIGDTATISFIQPNGVIYATFPATSGLSGNVCFGAYMSVAGFPAASYPGTWTIQTFWNKSTTPLFSLNFTIGLSGAGAPTGVLPQFAAGGSFVTDFYVVNSAKTVGSFSISFFADNGSPVAVPYDGVPVTILNGTVPAGGAGFYEVGTPQGAAQSGSALISSDPSITIQALFRRKGSNGSYYEAAVPPATGSHEVQVPFDATTFSGNGSQIYTGLAVANLAGISADLSCAARNSQGSAIPNAISAPVLDPSGDWAAYLFPALTGLRGTIDCTSNTQIGAVGIRALGTNALSSLPVITIPIGNSSGPKVLPQVAVGASFVTDFYVVNSSLTTSANFSISFNDDNGNPVALPFTRLGSLSTLSGTIPAGGSGFYEAGTPQGAPLSGSAVVSSDPSITIQALFRRLGSDGSYYEAAVPVTAGSNEILVPFDGTTFSGNGAQIYTGFAIANLDASASASLACTARDALGNTIPDAIAAPTLNPSGHWAAYLFPALTGLRGTLDCTSNTPIAGMGIRALGTNAISSLPVITPPNLAP